MAMISNPHEVVAAFAEGFNRRSLDDLLELYAPGAILLVNSDRWEGIGQIRLALENVLKMPGTMASEVNFCVVNDDVAVLRADYLIRDGDNLVMSGSSVEVLRREPDGFWRYLIDHATGAGAGTR